MDICFVGYDAIIKNILREENLKKEALVNQQKEFEQFVNTNFSSKVEFKLYLDDLYNFKKQKQLEEIIEPFKNENFTFQIREVYLKIQRKEPHIINYFADLLNNENKENVFEFLEYIDFMEYIFYLDSVRLLWIAII